MLAAPGAATERVELGPLVALPHVDTWNTWYEDYGNR